MTREEAKRKLDTVINKSRVHLYKPIQIAEILYHQRTVNPNLDLLDLESYRTKSRKWALVKTLPTLLALSQYDKHNAVITYSSY